MGGLENVSRRRQWLDDRLSTSYSGASSCAFSYLALPFPLSIFLLSHFMRFADRVPDSNRSWMPDGSVKSEISRPAVSPFFLFPCRLAILILCRSLSSNRIISIQTMHPLFSSVTNYLLPIAIRTRSRSKLFLLTPANHVGRL